MNQQEMNEVAALLEDASAQDYVQLRLSGRYMPLYTKAIIKAVCVHLREGKIEKVIPEVEGIGSMFSCCPQTKKVLLDYLVPRSCFER